MSVEHHHERTEHHEHQDHELEQAGREKLEELSHRPELAPDDAEHRAEAAREILHRHEQAPEEPKPAAETQPQTPRTLHLDYKLNYAQTVSAMQRRLTPVSRSFSKFIHAPAVEKTSEILERTVARPSVAAGATWTALIVGAVFYFTARHYGYMLSGSELLFSFVAGAVIGLAVEGLWRSLHRS
ncbi:MAG TPA: hypothetical protein VGH44_00595 [Candidatus Saccharimonadia bacterium]